jgi:hypothetical protein
MSEWPNRIFAVFSIIWVFLIIAALVVNTLARDFMMSPDPTFSADVKSYGLIIIVGVSIWYGFYRLVFWFNERS